MIPTHKVRTRRIDGKNVVLLPYSASFVSLYHSWMQSPELLELTESDALTLEQESANQVSWSTDPTKYCFIIHSRRPVLGVCRIPGAKGVQTPFGIDYTLENEEQAEAMRRPFDLEGNDEEEEGDEDEEKTADEEDVEAKRKDDDASEAANDATSAATSSAAAAASSDATAAVAAVPSDPAAVAASPATALAPVDGASAAAASAPSSSAAVAPAPAAQPDPGSLPYPLTPIGDVNLFLHPDFNLGDYGISGGGTELEIMIAEPSYRGRGLAVESVRLAMEFSARRLGVTRFVAKVLASNKPSVALFEKKLGFQLIEYVECFDERVYYLDASSTLGDEDVEEDEEEVEGEDTSAAVPTNEPSASAPAHADSSSSPAAVDALAADVAQLRSNS